MSKPISISFGKPKTKPSASTPSTARTTPVPAPKRPAFTADPEDDAADEIPPAHESVLGFAADGGAILSQPLQAPAERVIENKGNADWRTRGRPARDGASQQQQQQQQSSGVERGAGATTVERDEASKKAGLQFAEQDPAKTSATTNGHAHAAQSDHLPATAQKPPTADEAALSALLNHPTATASSSTTTTITPPREPPPRGNETLDFRTDVASRPDPATLSDYASMPVAEFGMALLRGMGKKRRANGEVIVIKNPNLPPDEEEKRREKETRRLRDPNLGLLGIGAKAVKGGSHGGEEGLGAWGKADMRRSGKGKGEGLYTPVMLRDRKTGELISEVELAERKKMAKELAATAAGGAAAGGKRDKDGAEEDWRERRDRNLQRDAIGGERRRDRPRADEIGSNERPSGSARKMIDPPKDERSRHSSRRRSRSRERSRRDRDRDRDGHRHDDSRSRDRERYRNDDDRKRYDSTTTTSSTSSSAARRNGNAHHNRDDERDPRGERGRP